jgi:CPA2 family monovalent cation:H+ antiporter-2
MHSSLLPALLLTYGLVLLFMLVGARLRIPGIVATMAAGVVAGPFGLGILEAGPDVNMLAELGIVLLLFTVGLDFSLGDVRQAWRSMLGAGLLQLLGSAAAVALVVVLLPWGSGRLAIFLGALVALSSTAIVLRGLTERNQLGAPAGRLTTGILLLQDLAVVVLLLLVPMLAGSVEPAAVPWTLAKALGAFVLVAVAGWLLVPRLLKIVASSQRREAFPLAVVLAALGTAAIAASLGVSMALGAFLGGLVIAGSEVSHQAHAEVRPLRDILASLFFVSLGTLIDPATVLRAWPLMLAVAAGILVLKTLATWIPLGLIGVPRAVALTTAIWVAQVGEFSFVLGQAGLAAGLLTSEAWQIFLGASILTMALTPALLDLAPSLGARFGRIPVAELRARAERLSDHVIILGFGVGGRMIASALKARRLPYLVLDLNGDTVYEERARGEPIFFGDAMQPDTLEAAHLDAAAAVVIVLSDPFATERTVRQIRRVAPRVPLFVRTRYRGEVDRMKARGATVAVAAETESSLEVLAQLLARLGVPGNIVEADLETLRAGGDTGRALRAGQHPMAEGPEQIRSMPYATHELLDGEWAVGRTLADLDLRVQTGVGVLTLCSAGHYHTPPPADRALAAGDLLYLLGDPLAVSAARTLLARGAAAAPGLSELAGPPAIP